MNRLLILLLLLNINVFAQSNSKTEVDSKTDYKIELLKQNFEIEKTQLKIDALEKSNQSHLEKLSLETDTKIEKLNSTIENYLLIGSVALAIILFLINFFGRKLIVDKIKNLVQMQASKYAEKKANQVIQEYIDNGKIEELIVQKGTPIIKKIAKKIELDGINVIDEIKIKGDKVISSMLASNTNELEEIPEKEEMEIKQKNLNIRATEFFNLAVSRKDPLVQIELYKNVLELEPNNIGALNNIGAAYNNAYNSMDAIKHLTKAIEINPNYAIALANLAYSYNLLNDLDKALEYANKAIEKNPNIDWSYSVKGNIFTKQGKLDEAEKTFGLAIKINPNTPEVYNTRGYFYEETGKYEEAEKDFIKAEKLGYPNKAMLYNNFAVLYRRKKEFDKAVKYLEKAREENPDFPNIDGTLALIYADKGERENFYKHLLIALEKGCPAWNYINDPGFDKFREEEKLNKLLESYKKKYAA
jgi:tetratricopeptide (TPR) repeat protein